MKRTVKIVLPLVLIAVLLIGAGWFFLLLPAGCDRHRLWLLG